MNINQHFNMQMRWVRLLSRARSPVAKKYAKTNKKQQQRIKCKTIKKEHILQLLYIIQLNKY